MNFYEECTSPRERDRYERMLVLMGSLSGLFSDNVAPYLSYRVTENVFCRCLGAENLSRSDITADAKKGDVGVGIKTWTGSFEQKIAEFNRDRNTYTDLSTPEMVAQISMLRNARIGFTKRAYGLSYMLYHCTVRTQGTIQIIECPLDAIQIENIRVDSAKNNIIKFSDGLNRYSFNKSKSTLYKYFDDYSVKGTLRVNLFEDPLSLLDECLNQRLLEKETTQSNRSVKKVFLPLYSVKHGEKYVPQKSGLNAGFAGGRKRDDFEVYIPISREFNKKYRSFFPPTQQDFELRLPDGAFLKAKICQEGDKALMSNPNKALGKWLLSDVLNLSPHVPVTYEMLEKYGVDSVEITKKGERKYEITFAKIGSYERFMALSS